MCNNGGISGVRCCNNIGSEFAKSEPFQPQNRLNSGLLTPAGDIIADGWNMRG
jgi:hypothetical protein